MPITILPAQASDSPTLIPIGLLAFANDPLNKSTFKTPNPTPSQATEHLQWRIRRSERRMRIADSHWFKAVDSSTGEVVGYAGCLAPEGVKVSGGVSAGARVEGDGALPEIVDGEWLGRWDGVLGEMKRECLGGREDVWYVASMVVHPSQQGRGIGRKLLDAICELADKAGQDVYLEASAPGRRLYEKAGFEVLQEKTLLGGPGPDMTAMLRRAKVG